MFLMDESLFNLWKNGMCDKEECLLKAQKPSELAARIAMAEKGLFEDEDDEVTDFEDDEDDDD